MEVALAIKEGKADVGIGIKYAARQFGLDFVPIKEEMFDFAVLKKNLEKDNIKKFIIMLSSNQFRKRLLSEDFGIVFHEDIGKIFHK